LDTGAAATTHTQQPSPCARQVLRVVLDTNVLLSLFVFADSRFLPLRGKIERGEWLALTSERCLGEFRRVLTYPMFGLDAARQQAALAAYAALASAIASISGVPAAPLPQCRDPDDQKFLELARDGAADWLVTSDKALLKLARRGRLRHLFRILTPGAALDRLADPWAPSRPGQSAGAALGAEAP
jgi:uncharacterized protein